MPIALLTVTLKRFGFFGAAGFSGGRMFAAALWLLLLAGSAARAEEHILAPVQVVPRETSVLLLPALDATRDSKNMQAPRRLVVRHRVEYEFITRQFKMLGETMAGTAADAVPKIELGDLSERTDTNLDLIARRMGADWVVNVVVEDAKLDASAGGEFNVRTRVRLQVWDARRRGWIVNGPYTGHASGGGSPVFVFKRSLDDAAKGSLGNLLGDYPQVVSVSQEGSLNDYLAGQTKPFVGDPRKSFSGLRAEP